MESQKKLRRPRRQFWDEFKTGAVRLVFVEGKSVTQVSRDLDLTVSSMGKWVEQARANQGQSKRGTLTTEEEEVRALVLWHPLAGSSAPVGW